MNLITVLADIKYNGETVDKGENILTQVSGDYTATAAGAVATAAHHKGRTT